MRVLARIERSILVLLGRRLQIVLIAFSSLVAALTVAMSTLALAGVTRDYLGGAEAKAAMRAARAIYEIELAEAAASSARLAAMPQLADELPAAGEDVDRQIVAEIDRLYGTRALLILLFDDSGNVVAGRAVSADGTLSPPIISGTVWEEVPVIVPVLQEGSEQAVFEIVPRALLARVGLAEQAPTSDGLALAGVSPVRRDDGQVAGAVATLVLLNDDAALADHAAAVSGARRVVVFLHDRGVASSEVVSGDRPGDLRMPDAVREQVLVQGQDSMEPEPVEGEQSIGHYAPLCDHRGQVVGGLYVRSRETDFLGLIGLLNERLVVIALVPGIVAALIAVPIARAITHPVTDLVAANLCLANGDMTVRVETFGTGELAVLGHSFNSMVKMLFETQQELVHKEKLAAVGQLAAGVAHELNNPLSAIMLLADVMVKEAPPCDPRRPDLEVVVNETGRCKRIIGDLLNFARQYKILARETDVHALLEKAVRSVDYQPSFDDVRIVRRFDPGLPAIYADPDQLLQVFVNLLNNSAEAMAGGGEITLSTRLIDDSSIEIQVADTGCGIPEENLSKLFTPFFTTKPVGKGTGLGLSIVHGIVRMHHGWIVVGSKVGEGSVFAVTLPIQIPVAELQHAPASMAETIH